jgi:hypothetical protein
MKWNYRIYDNGGATQDRYTAVFLNDPQSPYANRDQMIYAAIGFDETPFSPLGFGQHTTARLGNHLGKRIAIRDLPEDARKFVTQELENYAKVDK